MNILKRIFSGPENVGKIVDAGIKGLDALVFTGEEKAKANAEFRDWTLKYLKATQPQNLARRFIALIVVGVWAALILTGVVGYLFSPSFAGYVLNVVTENVNTPFGIVIGFYFLTHAIRAVGGKRK